MNRFPRLCWADKQTHLSSAGKGCDLSPRSVQPISVQRVYSDTDDSLTRPPAATHPVSANRSPITHRSRVVLRAIGQGLTHICFSLVRLLWILFSFFSDLFYSAANWVPVWVVTEQAEQLRFFVLLYFSFHIYTHSVYVNTSVRSYGRRTWGKNRIIIAFFILSESLVIVLTPTGLLFKRTSMTLCYIVSVFVSASRTVTVNHNSYQVLHTRICLYLRHNDAFLVMVNKKNTRKKIRLRNKLMCCSFFNNSM